MEVGAMTSTVDPENTEDQPYLEEFVRDMELQGKSDTTIRSYQSIVSEFVEWLDGSPTSVTRSELERYLRHLKKEKEGRDGTVGLAQSTLENKFSAISTFFKFLEYKEYVDHNPVPAFRERYLSTKGTNNSQSRQLISVKEMSTLVHSTLNIRNKALILLLAKTGIRRRELIQIDLSDIDWEKQSIKLTPNAKRSNLLVFFDSETARVLQRWLDAREKMDPQTEALFIGQNGNRLKRNGVYQAVTKRAEAIGLHDPDSDDLEERFTPHCCRHWFTTHLRRNGMDREFIKELRGDTRGEAIDDYDHIDREELRQSYLSHIPQLGI